MSIVNLLKEASELPAAWRSRVLAEVGTAAVKVLRMDEAPVTGESHEVTEVLLVIDGRLELALGDAAVTVRAGEMYRVPAGTEHAVRPGSTGTLVIVEVPEV